MKKNFTLPNKQGTQTKLSYQEFERMMKEMGEDFNQQDIQDFMEENDEPIDKRIDYPQYMEILRKKKSANDFELIDQFKAFDSEDTGAISENDFKMILLTTAGVSINADQIDDYIDKLEKDENGNILYKEFLKNFKFEY